MAQAIAAQIKIKLTAQEHANLARAHPVNPHAYVAYAEGSFFRNQWTEKGLDRSIELFSQAIGLDPAYAQGYAGLSHSYYALGIRGLVLPERYIQGEGRRYEGSGTGRDDRGSPQHAGGS